MTSKLFDDPRYAALLAAARDLLQRQPLDGGFANARERLTCVTQASRALAKQRRTSVEARPAHTLGR